MSALDMLKILLGEECGSDDKLLLFLLDEAEQYALAYTGLSELPARLVPTVARIAAINYNQRGMEGMSSVSAGGGSRPADPLPGTIIRALDAYPAGKVVNIRAPRRN